MNAPVVPSWQGVAASLILVALAIVVVWRQRLGLGREIAIAAGRAGGQLVLVGAVLLALFTHAGLAGSIAWVTMMIGVATVVAGRRAGGLPGAFLAAGIALAVSTAVALGTLIALRVVAAEPRIVVPVGGMIVSGAMQATGLALRRLREEIDNSRPAIETRLTLGVPVAEALLPYRRSAAQTAMMPTIDATKVVGLISLPGAMTGLIMAGVDPLTAIRYQIVVMYMQLTAAAIASIMVTRIAERALTDREAQRLRT